jgi:N-sulfoglucosamine sulfohydrolase
MTPLTRRTFLKTGAVAGTSALALPSTLFGADKPPNIMMITVDDLNYDAISWLGGQIEGLTPNIERLASQGLKFTRAYNTHSRCSPSRGSMMTGRYQDGYSDQPGTKSTVVRDSVTPLPSLLKQKLGYRTAVLGKETHYNPPALYDWDVVHHMADMGVGRHPDLYHAAADAFVSKAKADGVPFFLSANTHDPHRPFAGSAGERKSLKRRFKNETKRRTDNPTFHFPPEVDRYKPEDVVVPGFLPDLPEVREEISWYLNSTHRCDLFVGRMLEVLDDHDLADDTLVVFLSDNGMHFPFAKSNCYMTSVRTPLIFRWPGKIRPDMTSESIVSTVDLMPTILQATQCEHAHDMNGNSLSALFTDPEHEVSDTAFASINGKGKSLFEMRALIGKQYHYIYNHFADGTNQFYDGKYGGGRSLQAMEKAAETDPEMRKRIDFMYYRTKEELYDLRKDPDALNNLADNPDASNALADQRMRMEARLRKNDDPFASAFSTYLKESTQN